MKTLHRHIIILFGLLAVCLNVQATRYYWNPKSGSNSNDGLEAGKAVKTFDKAMSLVTSSSDLIMLCDTYTISAATTLDGSKGSYNVTVQRNSSSVTYLIQITAGVELTLENITLSGGMTGDVMGTHSGGGNAIIMMDHEEASVVLKDGTILKNNWTTYGPAIKSYDGGTIRMEGGEIYNCGTDNTGGAICMFSNVAASSFFMSGGIIHHCYAGTGGGAFCYRTLNYSAYSGYSMTIEMSGGVIKDCMVSSGSAQGGGAFYINSERLQTNAAVSFTMTGDSIKDCTAPYGGALFVTGKNTLNLNGGTIYNCTATGASTPRKKSMGGAVYMVTNTELTTEQNSEISMGVTTGGVTSGTTIQNCRADSIGGGVYMRNLNNNSTVSFTMNAGSLIDLCSCTNYNGGGVYMAGKASFTMNGGGISSCTAKNGAGVFMTSVDYNATASFTMGDGAVINNCSAGADVDGDGGGVYMMKQAVFTMNGGEIKYCHTKRAGGGVAVIGEAEHLNSVYLYGGEIHHCYARRDSGYGSNNGGGLHIMYSNVLIDGENVLVHDNETAGYGGGLNVQHGNLTINDGKIYNNRIVTWNQGAGGAIHFSRSHVFIMTGGEIYGNSSVGSGGAFHASYVNGVGDYMRISGGKIYNNTSAIKGGAFNINTGSLLEFVAGSGGQAVEMYGNKSCRGGAVSIDGGLLNIEAGSFHDNEADETLDGSESDYKGYGGAFLVMTESTANTTSGKLDISGGDFYNNVASQDGGVIYLQRELYSISTDEPSVTISGGTIHNNTATNGNGGGIYYDLYTKMYVDNGSMTVKDNLARGIPNNVYVKSGNVIDIKSGVTTFSPTYVGFYTENRIAPIPVFNGTNEQVTAIYNGMTSVPMTTNVVDDSQQFSPLDPGSGPILFFGSSPWSPLQQTIADDDDLPTPVGGVYPIGSVKDLTAFLWYVNHVTGHGEYEFDDDPHPEASAKLTADIDMEGHYWVPIANYEGTFDGNGYIISNLTMAPTNASAERGLIGDNAASGTIENVILRDCYFGSKVSTSFNYMGGIAARNSGTVCNNVVDGTLYASDSYCIMGGLVGYNTGTIHSCYAAPNMTGYGMGGLVGVNHGSNGKLLNSFANAKFTNSGSGYMGGLVNQNSGTVENCYTRLQGSAPASNFGYLVGSNQYSDSNGTLNYCYAPATPYTVDDAGTKTGLGTYGATSTPYLYNHRDNQVDVTVGTNTYVSNITGADKQMLIALNSWVADPDHASSNYTYWLRTTTKTINDDLPLLRLPATNAVAATNGEVYLDYNQVNDLLTGYTTDDKAICLYGAEASMNGNAGSAAPLYIDQEATLKQSGSKGAINARTSQMLQTYTAERWHHFSSPLTHSDIGFTYHNASPVPYAWGLDNPCSVTINGDDDHSLFPSNLLTATTFNSVDLFCFYEPEYHWLNLKRASDSHWHMNATEEPIAYNGNGIGASTNGNETYLVPGKGYLISVDVDQLVQNYGTLNDGDVTLYSVTKSDYNAWAERLGFNLLGNPYQSYLDFEEFKTQNGTNLWASSADIYEYTYAVFDPQLNAYRQYKDGSSVFSNAASRYIHPHQGFFIRMTQGTNSNTTVTYTNAMRVVTLPENVTSPYRGEAQPAFPLINLVVSDSEGNADLAVLELDRDNDEGAEKIRLSEGKGLLSLGYEGRDYGILFRTKIEDYQPLRFEALEEGTFTLEWSTANGEFSELTLIDNIAGTATDMLSRDSYNFEANPDQYASRFKIVIGHYKDVEEHEDGPSTGSETFAFQMGDELIVNGEGTLQMFDVTGRLLMQASLHGSQTNIALPEVSAGVYVLHLANDRNGMKTQKIILE